MKKRRKKRKKNKETGAWCRAWGYGMGMGMGMGGGMARDVAFFMDKGSIPAFFFSARALADRTNSPNEEGGRQTRRWVGGGGCSIA